MAFVQFPNGKVWQLDQQGWIKGSTLVPEYANLGDLEQRLDAIAEAATGSICGLTDFAYQARGGDIVSFHGFAAEVPVDEEEFNEEGFKVLEPGSAELTAALAAQYGLSTEQAAYAVSKLNAVYDDEVVIDVLGSQCQIRKPAQAEDGGYVRVTLDGFELASWRADDPACAAGLFAVVRR